MTSVRASSPPLTLLGSLGGIEAGLRQLRRTRPLETERVSLGEVGTVVAPSAAETLRIKAYLIVQRNQVRDYLDVVALADRLGHEAADPRGPVAGWPYEALVTAIERGTIGDWARLTRAIGGDPWGGVARQVEEYLSYEHPYGVAPLLERAITRARAQADVRERAAVAAEVRELQRRSGLGSEQFARRIGTSRSRFSTYRSGKVMPSAGLMLRMRDVPPRPAAAGRRARARPVADHHRALWRRTTHPVARCAALGPALRPVHRRPGPGAS